MSMRRPATLLLALILGALSAGLVACGSSSSPKLLSGGRADQINSALDDVRAAVDAHQCAQARRALQRLDTLLATLPRSTDARLQQRLQDGASALARDVPRDCVQTQTTPTVTETTPTVTTQTETTTTQTTATTTTPTTTTTTPTTTPTVPTTTAPGNGGTTTPTTP